VTDSGVGTIWLTGLPAAGKTTVAHAVRDELAERGVAVCVLDGDVLRRGLSSDLGMSPADRGEQARRAAHVAALLSGAGVVAVVALVSPYRSDRLGARQIHDERGLPFVEVWVDTPLAICQERDPKGLYARARAGEVPDLTGVGGVYEPPEDPELRVSGDQDSPEEAAGKIVELLLAVQART
jgi:adenylyl-sulfate kinase